MMETLEQMWEAGVYYGYGEPPDEWYRTQRLRHCPYRNAVQLDFLEALRAPTLSCPVCGGEATELIDGMWRPCDEFRPPSESV